MKKTKNGYLVPLEEREIIKALIDKKYNKITTSKDYNNDSGVREDVLLVTKESIGGSTLERMVGIDYEEGTKFRKTTLLIVADYLGIPGGIEEFNERLKYSLKKSSNSIKEFKIESLLDILIIKVTIGSIYIEIKKTGNANKYIIIRALNTKLKKDDIIEIKSFNKGAELILSSVERKEKGFYKQFGIYKSGFQKLVDKIELYGEL